MKKNQLLIDNLRTHILQSLENLEELLEQEDINTNKGTRNILYRNQENQTPITTQTQVQPSTSTYVPKTN